MASTYVPYDVYRTGSSMSYPVVIKSPYADYSSLLVRVKVKTASELFIGALCEQADSGTKGIVEKTSDKSLKVFGIVVDNLSNIKQLEKDNSGTTATKALFFAANSYIWVLPLISGFILSFRVPASSTIDEGNTLCSNATGEARLMAAIATDVDPAARIARVVGGIVTSGNGVQYIAGVVI